MRKLVIRLLCCVMLLCCSMLSGCIHTVQLKDRALVQAVGIDFEDKKYQVSVQIFTPQGSDNTKIDMSKPNCIICTGEGESISEAMTEIMRVQRKTIFMGHNRLVVLSESAAKAGIQYFMSYFDTNSESRLTIDVLLTKGKALDIISAQIKQGITPGDAIDATIENGSKNGTLAEVKFIDVMRGYYGNYKCFYLPVIKLTETEDRPVAEINGAGIFRQGRLTDYLTQEETKSMLWAVGKNRKSLVVADVENMGKASALLSEKKLKIDVNIVEEKPIVDVSIFLAGQIIELESVNKDDTYKRGDEDKIQVAMENKLTPEIQSVINTCIKDYKSDVFGIARRIRDAEPEYFAEHGDDITKLLDEAQINVKVKVKIDQINKNESAA